MHSSDFQAEQNQMALELIPGFLRRALPVWTKEAFAEAPVYWEGFYQLLSAFNNPSGIER